MSSIEQSVYDICVQELHSEWNLHDLEAKQLLTNSNMVRIMGAIWHAQELMLEEIVLAHKSQEKMKETNGNKPTTN